jgi:hypothetical protein
MNGTLDCALVDGDGGREVLCRGEAHDVFGDDKRRQRFEPVAALRGARAISTPGGRSLCVVDDNERVRCLHHGWLRTPPEGAAAEVDLGGNVACARAPTGTVSCWNWLDSPGIADATAIAVGGSHACAIRRDGSMACWGDDENGQCGAGIALTQPRPVRVAGVRDVRRLVLGRGVSCAQRTDGRVVCWGGVRVASAAPMEIPSLQGATALALSQTLLVGILPGGGMRVVALATLGRERRIETEVLPSLAKPTAISIDRVPNICAVHGRQLSCMFGMGYSGGPSRWTAVDGAEDPVELAATATGLCARERAGTVVCLRDDRWDNDERFPEKAPPRRLVRVAGLDGVVALEAGQSLVYARRSDGSVVEIDMKLRVRPRPEIAGAEELDGNHQHLCILRAGVVACEGSNGWGEIGSGVVSSSIARLPLTEVKLPLRAAHVGAGFDHSCAVDEGGDVWCWGANVGGEVDGVRAAFRATPVTVRFPD